MLKLNNKIQGQSLSLTYKSKLQAKQVAPTDEIQYVTPDTGYDGLSTVTVEAGTFAPPVLDTLNVTANGTYTPPAEVDGYDAVNVALPAIDSVQLSTQAINNGFNSFTITLTAYTWNIPTTITNKETINGQVMSDSTVTAGKRITFKTVNSTTLTANGDYNMLELTSGGIPKTINVNVPTPTPVTETLTVTANGTYTPATGVDGFSRVVVNVPAGENLDAELTTQENSLTSLETVVGTLPTNVTTKIATFDFEVLVGEQTGVITTGFPFPEKVRGITVIPSATNIDASASGSVWTFIGSEIIVPTSEPTSLNTQATLIETEVNDNQTAIRTESGKDTLWVRRSGDGSAMVELPRPNNAHESIIYTACVTYDE